jgi:hypothetical protein
MAHSSTSKKSNKDDSGSDSEEEVSNSPSILIAENARLNELLDNHDDVFRKTNNEKREYRSLLGEAKEKVIELESLLDDARAQIDSLKSAPIVTNQPECTDCSSCLGALTVLKENYASKVEELDVLRVELDEMKSRPTLLGACTTCPVLLEKLDVFLVYARSLEAQLKAPITTICYTCEMNVVKNMELAHYVDRLQDENDELRKLMGWLSGHEPQLRIMIETYKRHDGEALGAKKAGEEVVRVISQSHQKPTKKMPLFLSRIILGTDYTQPHLHPCFLYKPTTSRNPSSSRVSWGMSSLARRERNPVRGNRVRRNQSPKRTKNRSQNRDPSIVSIVGGMGT